MERVALAMKEVPKSFLRTEGDDVFDAELEENSSEDDAEILDWVYESAFHLGDANKEISDQYKRAMAEPHQYDPFKRQLMTFYKDNLRVHKLHMLHLKHEMVGIRGESQQMKDETKRIIDDRLSLDEMTRVKTRLGKEEFFLVKYSNLEARFEKIEDNIALILKNQATQT